MILGEAKKLVTSMSRNRICMEQMTRLDIDPRGFIIFPFGGGEGVGRGGRRNGWD